MSVFERPKQQFDVDKFNASRLMLLAVTHRNLKWKFVNELPPSSDKSTGKS